MFQDIAIQKLLIKGGKMKHIVIVVFSVLFLLFTISSFFADDTQFFSYYVTPDVWIIFDTSGSMSWDMQGCHTWGDGSEDYEGRDTDGDGLPNDARLYMVKNAIHGLVNDPEIDIRWGLASFYQSEYNGESDDWYRIPDAGFLYPVWSECYSSPSSYSRPNMWWHSATRPDAYEAFFMRVEMSEGAPAHLNAISEWVDNVTSSAPKKEFHAQGGTPLAGALRGVRYEYMSKIPSDNAKWCRGYYVILLTDGEPTYGIDTTDNVSWSGYNGSSPQWMKDQCYQEAESLMHTYIPPHGGDPDTVLPIKTYVIGIGMVGSGTLDSIAIAGGTEHYYPATNPEELQEVLRAIVSDIISQATSYAGAEVTSIQEEFITSTYEARMYLCTFIPSYKSIWEGHCKAVKLVTGTFNIDSIPDSLIYWDAGEILDTTHAASRMIYTEKNQTLLSFDTGNISAADLDVATIGARDSIINTVYAGRPSDTTGYLGDIFHSSPLRIRGPNYFYEDDDFYDYREYQNNNRDPMIYAGGNDGMLHCFNDSTGEEEWAFIPNDQLIYLKYLLIEHDYYQDGTIMAADIWFPNPAGTDSFKNEDEWTTVLIAGQRQGGSSYTALDVTDPYNMNFLFNFVDTMGNLGETWSNPVMFKIHKNSFSPTDERFFCFLGGGYWPDTLYDKFDPWSALPYGNSFFALDIVNMVAHNTSPTLGIDYWEIPAATQYVDSMVWPFPSQPAVIDTNLDTYADILLMGDYAGQLWKVNINGTDSADVIVDDWEAEILFNAPRPSNVGQEHLWQPIFFPPTAVTDGRRWWFYFGTGDRARAEKEGTVNRFYAIIDSTYTTPLTEADLKNVSDPSGGGPLTEAEILAGTYKGWYYIFTDFNFTDSIGKRDGEKATSFATVLMDTLIFTTFQPYNQNDPCISVSGIARLYKIYYKSGDWTGTIPSTIVGSGLPQAPRYTFDISGDGLQVINLPGQVIVQPTPGLGIRRKILWWHETY